MACPLYNAPSSPWQRLPETQTPLIGSALLADLAVIGLVLVVVSDVVP